MSLSENRYPVFRGTTAFTPVHSPSKTGVSALRAGYALAVASVLDCHAVDVVLLEILAGGLGLVLVETGEARTVERGAALVHRLGERIGGREQARRLALDRAQPLLG